MASATTTSAGLSTNDSRILTQVFDPEAAADSPSIQIDPGLPADPHVSADALSNCRRREVEAIKLIETAGANDKGAVYVKALGILSKIIEEYPKYASAYNNRAQLHRWHLTDMALVTSPEPSPSASEAQGVINSALEDLETCISLASLSSPATAISPSQVKILSKAWTQRATVFWNIAKSLKARGLEHIQITAPSNASSGSKVGGEWKSWDRMRMEEEGSRCFYMAGLYGSEVGKAMAVASNPYARLCGSIVKEAMRGEAAGS